jgi:hypothetical protein
VYNSTRLQQGLNGQQSAITCFESFVKVQRTIHKEIYFMHYVLRVKLRAAAKTNCNIEIEINAEHYMACTVAVLLHKEDQVAPISIATQ